MISTILTSIHTFTALVLLTLAALIFLAGLRTRQSIAATLLIVSFAGASVAFGLAFNSFSTSQVLPWLITLIVFTYPVAPAALLVGMLLLRPKLGKSPWTLVILWAAILVPVILIGADLTNVSQQVFTNNALIDLDRLATGYTGGYISHEIIETPAGNTFLQAYIYVFYLALLVFSATVTIQDWKKDHFNRTNGAVLTAATLLSVVISLVFQDILPQTVPELLSNFVLAFGFFHVTLRITAKDKPEGNPWLQNILDDYPMFTKLTSTLAILLIPTIAFLSFSTFSFFQSSLVSSAADSLVAISRSEAQQISFLLEEPVQDLTELRSENQSNLLAQREETYREYTDNQILQVINQNEGRWADQDLLFISVTLDPAKNVVMRNLKVNNPNYLNIVLVDGYGGLITATENPGSYNFRFSEWFENVSENQEPYVSDFRWNEAVNAYTADFAVPLFSPNGGIYGVMKAEYQITEILENLSPTNENQISTGLATTSGLLVTPREGTVAEIEYPLNALTPAAGPQNWRAFELNEQSYLFETSEISSFRRNVRAPWLLATFQPISEAIAPLAFARSTTLIIALVIALFSGLLVVFLTQSIVSPLEKLRAAAEEVQAGKPGAVANLTSRDEFGALASTFNQMSSELRQVVSGLEETIQARTKDLAQRAHQLEASAVVARRAAEAKDLTTLLDLVTMLVPESFGHYHCGIFLVDEQRRYAVLEAANSEGGQKMLSRGHRLQIGRVGVVGFCAGTGQPRIAQDVGADVTYYANPDMPATRSEMALPLIVREQSIGVLDIQSTEANAFSQDDIEILQVLADQLALAIDNTRLLESSQRALAELEGLYGQEAARSWQSKLAGEEIAFAYDSTGLIRAASETPFTVTEGKAQLSKPITFRGQVIGNLDFVRDEVDGAWTDEENQLIDEILEQTALALENARLVQQIRLRSDQIRLLQEITAMAASIMDEDELLQTVAHKLQTSLQAQHCGVVLRDEDPDYFTLTASATQEESDIIVGNQINIHEDPITQAIVETADNLAVHEVIGDPKYQVFVQTFSTKKPAAVLLLPLAIRDQVIGYIFLEDRDERKLLDQEEDDLFTQISAQISTAIESARLFKAEQQGRIAAAALLEITQIASASLDINRVLNQATNRSAQAIQAHRCSILLLDEKEKLKPLVSIYATGQAMEGEEWEALQTGIRDSYQTVPLRTLAANMREVAIVADPLTYKRFPLSWAADFEITSLLMVPLISQNKVIGTMVYDQVDPAFNFRESQIELAQTIAGQIATTIENANLFEQAVTRAERERQITEITAKIRSSNDPKEIMETAISELRAALAQSTLKAKQTAQKPQSVKSNGKDTGTN